MNNIFYFAFTSIIVVICLSIILKVLIKKFNPEKDFTDTQLALQQASSADESNYAILTGCFGGRMDHLFSNIFSN